MADEETPVIWKTPQEFVVGETIRNSRGTPYSGAPIVKVEGIGDGVTQVTFNNGEIVEFYNGIQHPILVPAIEG